jgi:hypothetical protein
MMKFCKDCKWFRLDAGMPAEFANCVQPDLVKYDPVDGKLNTFCRTERRDYGTPETDKCGAQGKLWEQFQPGVFEPKVVQL